MSCIGGANVQCSGSEILRAENGVAMTRSGVEVYGKSTSDLATPVADPTTASGLAQASGGTAEVRISKASNGVVSQPALILKNLDISWDGKNDRPTILETFHAAQGRTLLDTNGNISYAALPPSSDLTYYDFALKQRGATQANYANNQYFPRNAPSRCPSTVTGPCPTAETSGLQFQQGDWTNGGVVPHQATVTRLHEDGDVHAGDGPPDANGNPTILPGGSGYGAPFPGSKGYRQLLNWSYQYGNLALWKTQDTVKIVEWTGGSGADEHSQSRDGFVAFGDVTDPATVPTSGSATYSGVVYGLYAANAVTDASFFSGAAVITVNFATRQVAVSIKDTKKDDGTGASVPVTFNATVSAGAASSGLGNYLTGTAANATFSGGLSGRYFGPVAGTGANGRGPAEIGGTFTLSNPTTHAIALGGFIGRKQ
jgi:hypothetical protein